MLMMRAPSPWDLRSGSAAWVTRKTPVRSTARTRFQVSSEVFSNGALGASPALLTRISMGPNAARAAFTPLSMAISSVTSKPWATQVEAPSLAPSASSGSARLPASVTRAPASTSAVAMAAPMPLPAPVTSAWRPSSFRELFMGRFSLRSSLGRRLAGQVGLVLQLAGIVLLRPGNLRQPDACGLMQHPGGIGEMRACHGAKVGTAGRDDGVRMVRFGDRADGDRRDADLVADLVGERRLEEAAVDRLFLFPYLPGRAVDHVGAGVLEHPGEDRSIVRRVAALEPVVAGEAHRDRLVGRPGSADGAEDFQRIAGAVLVAAAIVVCAPVGERRQEAGEQVAVRAVQFQPVGTGGGGELGRPHEIRLDAIHVSPVHRFRDLAIFQIGQGGSGQQRPAASRQRLVHAFPGESGCPLAARMTKLDADLCSAV